MTTKAWYWTGLGVLAISLCSSSAGRCLMDYAAGLVQKVQAHALPYIAMAEIAFGHTEVGFGHMQSAAAQVNAQRARLEAEQARVQAEQARVEGMAAQQAIQRASVLAAYSSVGTRVMSPEVSVGPAGVIVRTAHSKRICPQIRVEAPGVEVQSRAGLQDPI
jgi:hypothetical protein